MLRTATFVTAFALLATGLTHAQAPAKAKQVKVKSAESAGPSSLVMNATIMDWDQTVLRKGSNGWTCFPDMPDTSGNDPMCLDAPWLNWVDAWVNKKQPTFTQMGFGYMLQGSSPESNKEPYATGPTATNEWIDNSIPHIMMIVPDPKMLDGLPTAPNTGGPWVMWRGTPYVHIMIPTPRYEMHSGH
jgi:hypothetical protein